jgi:hypothetical protein
MELKIQLDSIEKSRRGSYKPRVKAKLESHLLLTEENRARLNELLRIKVPGFVEIQWDLTNNNSIQQRDKFLKENGLTINPDNIQCKWSIRQSIPTAIIRQCKCGSYRPQVIGPTSRISAARYPYVGCLAFVKVSLRNNQVCAAAGYLEHSEQCKDSRPRYDPVPTPPTNKEKC